MIYKNASLIFALFFMSLVSSQSTMTISVTDTSVQTTISVTDTSVQTTSIINDIQMSYVCQLERDSNGNILPGFILCNGTQWENPDLLVLSFYDWMFWFYLLGAVFFILVAGLMSGLTLGLMGLDMTTLEVLQASGTALEKKQAEKIMPIVKRHHLLLVTLLLMNSVAMESLPIFLVRILTPIATIAVSVSLILLFGEIIPQALCNKYGLAIGSSLNILVWFLMLITFPISWPISKLLDFLLGKDNKTRYRRTELRELVKLHGKQEDNLSHEEVNIISGALDLKRKTILHILKPIQDVIMLNITEILTYEKKNKFWILDTVVYPCIKGIEKLLLECS